MKNKRAAAVMTALMYAQGMFVVAAVAAALTRLPDERTAAVDHQVVASIVTGAVQQ
jgi:hypothetical protein